MRNYVTLVFFGALLLIVGCKNEKEQIISEEEIVIEKTNPLPSWNDVKSKKNIVAYV